MELENTSTGVYDDIVKYHEEANEQAAPPTGTVGKDGIKLSQCTAYDPVPTPNDDGNLKLEKDDLYATITLP